MVHSAWWVKQKQHFSQSHLAFISRDTDNVWAGSVLCQLHGHLFPRKAKYCNFLDPRSRPGKIWVGWSCSSKGCRRRNQPGRKACVFGFFFSWFLVLKNMPNSLCWVSGSYRISSIWKKLISQRIPFWMVSHLSWTDVLSTDFSKSFPWRAGLCERPWKLATRLALMPCCGSGTSLTRCSIGHDPEGEGGRFSGQDGVHSCNCFEFGHPLTYC